MSKNRTSGSIESGHSKREICCYLKVCNRPEADVEGNWMDELYV